MYVRQGYITNWITENRVFLAKIYVQRKRTCRRVPELLFWAKLELFFVKNLVFNFTKISVGTVHKIPYKLLVFNKLCQNVE